MIDFFSQSLEMGDALFWVILIPSVLFGSILGNIFLRKGRY